MRDGGELRSGLEQAKRLQRAVLRSATPVGLRESGLGHPDPPPLEQAKRLQRAVLRSAALAKQSLYMKG